MPNRMDWGPPGRGTPGPYGRASGGRIFRRVMGFMAILILTAAVTGAVVATGLAALEGGERWVVVGLVVVLFVAFGLFLRRQMTRTWAPVGELLDATQKLADGDAAVRIQRRDRSPFGRVAESFNVMAARLEEEETRRRRLLADLGHELRTPLTVIRGEIEAVLDGLHPPDSLSGVVDEVTLMERLLEDLRLLSIAEAGQLRLEYESVDIGNLVKDCVASFASVHESQGIDVVIEEPKRSASIEADPYRIHQVLSNLISNANKAMQDGGRLLITVEDLFDEVVVEVADSGQGIPDDQLDRIFDRFATAAGTAGSGLGLSIARDLVEAHGGNLSARNHDGGGAVFVVTLPVSQGTPS